MPDRLITSNEYIDENYEILRLINSGGTAKIYLAKDKRIGKLWAIKEVIKTGYGSNAFLKEAEILKELDHPALPRITNVEESDKAYYVVMDYIKGEDFRKILYAQTRVPQKDAIRYGITIAEVLSYLHDKGIIYGDLKPSNIMLSNDGSVKLVDFGIAREGGGNEGLGTKGYAAPEQYTSQKTDIRTDIYGFGATMYHLLTGEHPEGVETLAIRQVDPHLSSGLEHIILKCTEENPADRFRSADELRRALISYRKYDEAYLDEKKATLRHFRILVVLTFICAMITVFSNMGFTRLAENQYISLLSGSPTLKNIETAIGLMPEEKQGYYKLLEELCSDGSLSQEDLSEFNHFYGEGTSKMDAKSFADVSMNAGETILNQYEDDSERAKFKCASPYLKAAKNNYEKSDERYEKACLYVDMAEFYEDYVVSDDTLLTDDIGKEGYEDILATIKGCLNTASGTEQSRLLLSMCNITASTVFEKADAMKASGISEKQMKEVLALARQKAEVASTPDPKAFKKKAGVLQALENAENKVDTVVKSKD